MNNKLIAFALMASTSLCLMGQKQRVSDFRYAGPYEVKSPVLLDSVDVQSVKYDVKSLLSTPISIGEVFGSGKTWSSALMPTSGGNAIHLLGFTFSNTSYTSASIEVKGATNYQLFVDGKKADGGKIQLQPAQHKAVIKYLSVPGGSDSLSVTVDGDKVTLGDAKVKEKRTFSIYDVLSCAQYSGVDLSPDGRFLLYGSYSQSMDGSETRRNYIRDLTAGWTADVPGGARWMPRSNRYMTTQKNGDGTYKLMAVDPLTRKETTLATALPKQGFTMSPTEDYVVYSVVTTGPQERKDVYEVVEPDDRQPGWRDRSNLYMYSLKTGIAQPLTFGYHNVYLLDISQDGKYLLIEKTEYDAKMMRPTDVASIYRLNVKTMEIETLLSKEGFISSAKFSPDGSKIILSGSPECLGGIGMAVAEGQTPNDFDHQLYLIDISKRLTAKAGDYSDVVALTRDFNPNVDSYVWNANDGMIYFSAEDKDCINFFRLNPSTRKIQRLTLPEESMGRFVMAKSSATAAYYAQSATNPYRLYMYNTKTMKSTLLDDVNKDLLADVDLGECKPFDYINPEGDTICCRYYLPPHFDASKRYPMIVNYYGGCSPTSRTFGGRYSSHAYSALGYVVLIVNPRGATGFGQKWSATHVNTAGKGVAEDIIGAVKAFTTQHSFVNDKKIGCIGASYGGFMTQYLQTQTDIFAAAVSHAGISDHTSYWGEGYWGYSYSQTSMANSYPWTRKDLYVDQSPLYNADKIHTPLLFVHGTADTNVPVGESIQMYTALKLLGRPTAMVLVEGENHWILEYGKRLRWQNTIWAWFAKWLQDDSSWWESMYKNKNL